MFKKGFISSVLIGSLVYASVPNHLDFQGLAVDSNGNRVSDSNIAIKFEILNSSNTVVFTESNTSVPTSSDGVFSLNIGYSNSDFENIDWSDSSYSLKVSTDYDISDGINYSELGTKSFSSVPYALVSKSIEGFDNNISNESISWGRLTLASGSFSTAFGRGSLSSGDYSTATGYYTIADNDKMFVVGEYNTENNTYGIGSEPALFVVGNGSDGNNRSDAFSVYKNGMIKVHENLVVDGTFTLSTGASSGKVLVSDSSGGGTWQTINTLSSSSPTISGSLSNAWGNATTASGTRSTAWGNITTASGTGSTALGRGSLASGDYSTATGYYTISDHDNMFVVGKYNTENNVKDIGDHPALFVVGNGSSTSSRSDAFSVYENGNALLAGTLTQNSDERLKINIQNLDNSLEKILSLRGVSYNWISQYRDQSTQIGVIAQEIENIYPELISTDSNGFKSVNYIALTPILIEAIKEQQKIIEQKEDKLDKIIKALEKAGILIEE